MCTIIYPMCSVRSVQMIAFYKYSNLYYYILTNELVNNLSRVIICFIIANIITSWLHCGTNPACYLILHKGQCIECISPVWDSSLQRQRLYALIALVVLNPTTIRSRSYRPPRRIEREYIKPMGQITRRSEIKYTISKQGPISPLRITTPRTREFASRIKCTPLKMVGKYMSHVQRNTRSLYPNTKSNSISTVIKVRHKGKQTQDNMNSYKHKDFL